MASNIWGRITEFFTTSGNAVARQIRVVSSYFRRASWSRPSQDWSRPDYQFWRKAYYCRAEGLELSGLFIRPLVNKIAAWSLGRAPNWKLTNQAAAQALTDWWTKNHPTILRGLRAGLRQGDAFLVINSDLTVTLVPPDLVEPIVAEDDFSVIIGWRVTQVQVHPERTAERLTIIDEYYADRRIHRVERAGVMSTETTYPNLIGRLQIVHIANQPDDGEMFGHAEAEALLEVFQRYGEALEAAVEGNILQGRPTPTLTFATVEDLELFDEENATIETRTLPNGKQETVKIYDVDLSQLLVASGATFKYESGGSFSADTVALLGLMFYLILQHTELPEFVFGNAIASSQASAETQMPIFVRFIEMRRGEMAAWLTEVAEIVLAYLSLIEPGASADETPGLQWEALDQQDGRLTLDTVVWAHEQGLIDDKTAIMLSGLGVENIDEVLAAAKKQREERQMDTGKTPDQIKAMTDAAQQLIANEG